MLEGRRDGEPAHALSTRPVRGAAGRGARGGVAGAAAARASKRLDGAARRPRTTRATAVNLAWGVDRALAAKDPVARGQRITVEDVERSRGIGANGAPLLTPGSHVLTHCNAGSLATVGYGTAIGVIRAAHEQGREPSVWVDETRPVLQG